jgi:hypothetical protein
MKACHGKSSALYEKLFTYWLLQRHFAKTCQEKTELWYGPP